jgi:LacI family transcriptional regulator
MRTYQALKHLGMDPRGTADLSPIGFEKSLQAVVMYPSLTTIAQPVKALKEVSVSLLIERIKNPTASTSKVMLPTTVIEQESCRVITTSG